MLVIIIPATSKSPHVRLRASSWARPSGSVFQPPPELGQHLQHGHTNKALARALAGAGSQVRGALKRAPARANTALGSVSN